MKAYFNTALHVGGETALSLGETVVWATCEQNILSG